MVLDKIAVIRLDLSKQFPFEAPLISIELRDEEIYYSMYNLERVSFEDVMREHWHPSIKLADIAEKSIEFANKNIVKIKTMPHSLTKISHILLSQERSFMKILSFIFLTKLLILVALTFNDALKK